LPVYWDPCIKNSISNFPQVIKTKCQENDGIISPFLDIIEIIQNKPIMIEYNKFLETLMSNLHDCIISHQQAHKKKSLLP